MNYLNLDVDILKKLRLQFISKTYEIIQDDTNLFIVMEYTDGRDFAENIALMYFAKKYCLFITPLIYFIHAENVIFDEYNNIRFTLILFLLHN